MRCGVRSLCYISGVGCFICLFSYITLFRKGSDLTRLRPQTGSAYEPLASYEMPTLQRTTPPVEASALDTQKCQAAYNRSLSAAKLHIAGYNHTHVPDCRLPLCDLNNNHVPVNVLTCDAPADKRVTEKVTVIVKTTQRLTETMRLIRSLHQYYPGLKVEVVDDEANIIRRDPAAKLEMQRLWQDFVNKSSGVVNYTKLSGDAGISKGRNTALRLVKSKYFLLLDDDFSVTEKTNLPKMVDILDRTDATIVGGDLAEGKGRRQWSGVARIHQHTQTNQSQLFEYRDLAYEEIPFFPTCYTVDLVLNLFLGKTEQILKFGGWDENIPVGGEHRDFLLGLRKSGHKVAYCTDAVFTHLQSRFSLYSHTKSSFDNKYGQYYAKKWTLPYNKFFNCNSLKYFNYTCS